MKLEEKEDGRREDGGIGGERREWEKREGGIGGLRGGERSRGPGSTYVKGKWG